jgi:protein SCO1/2
MSGPLLQKLARNSGLTPSLKGPSLCVSVGLGWLLVLLTAMAAEPAQTPPPPGLQIYPVQGVVVSLDTNQNTITIRHEAISHYMPAMTMPFHVKATSELAGVAPGDQLSFQFLVSSNESWIKDVKKLGLAPVAASERKLQPTASTTAAPHHPLLDYKFTNELGQAVSLSDFRGQALGITFFFTRCPVPDFCPRLSKNFSEASRQLTSMAGGPTNWHFLSVSFDTAFDTPAVLKAYGESYQYDPKRWNFLTGPADKIGELARLSGIEVQPDAGSFNHNFRTLIVDAAGHLQTTIPVGGNLSDMIVREMLRAAAPAPPSPAKTTAGGLSSGAPGQGVHPAATVSSR